MDHNGVSGGLCMYLLIRPENFDIKGARSYIAAFFSHISRLIDRASQQNLGDVLSFGHMMYWCYLGTTS